MGQWLRLHGEASAPGLLSRASSLSLTPLLGVSLLIFLIAHQWRRRGDVLLTSHVWLVVAQDGLLSLRLVVAGMLPN